MTFNIGTLFFGAIAYLLLLFLVAYTTERHQWSQRLVRSSVVYVLSLGVYATTWSYYGSVGFAQHLGLNFLTIYLGVTLAFILAPVLLLPILRITRTHQLTSVADLFAFRFNSQAAGVLVTLVMLTGSLPYIALQIRAVAESTQVLAGETHPGPIALGFCVMVTVFAVIFGARHVTPREKHTGLVAAIAFESLFKLAALLIVAVVAVYAAFGGFGGLDAWLAQHPAETTRYYHAVARSPWASLLFLSFSAAFLLPRQFHMIFTENLKPRSLLTASWGFPLYLGLLSLATPPILWAAQVLEPSTSADYYVLGIAAQSGSPALAMLAYLGGISAASAMIIVTTLALSSMSLNHLLLPLVQPGPRSDFYTSLRWARRALIGAIIGAGYGFFALLERSESLVSWGLISFLAMAQFVPGVIAILLWPRATRTGFVAGLLGGGAVWVAAALLPALTGLSPLDAVGIALPANRDATLYGSLAFWSVALNALLLVVFSILTRPSERETEAAAACRDVSTLIPAGALRAESPTQFAEQLAPVMGESASMAEVSKALADLGLEWRERRPERLQDLRDQIERNLSGMMGPMLARMIVDERLQLDTDARTAQAQNVRLIEERLESSRSRFRGLAAELDQLRRYHRQILEDLPLGIIAVTRNSRIVRWNPAMTRLTGVTASQAIGRQIGELRAPWGFFLANFLLGRENHAYKQRLRLGSESRWLSLHKTAIGEPGRGQTGDTLLLVEDVTELQVLEEELTHSERLASIGRLAAGVAHEIGNPVTGIACLAQELRGDEASAEDIAEEILEQTQRINNIVQTLVSYAHAGANDDRRPAEVNLAEAVEEARRVVRLSKRARNMAIELNIPPDLYVVAEYQRLVQVFVNLFSNAVDACGDGGQVEVTAALQGNLAQIRVLDDGPGIPAGIRDKVLEPFFTTKAPGKGTGLGLPLVYNIIKDQGGELHIPSRGKGAEFTITLPLAEPHAKEA